MRPANRRGIGYAGVAGALYLSGACAPAEPIVILTEHLHIEPSDSDTVCRGSLDNMEALLGHVATFLMVEIPSPIRLFYGDTAVSDHCGEGLGGCTSPTRVFAKGFSVYHELVHAVRFVGRVPGTRFFEEGLAVVLSGFQPEAQSVEIDAGATLLGPVELNAIPWDDRSFSDYGIAAHFVSWLIDEFGQEAVARFYNDEGYMSRKAEGLAFEEAFGLTLAEAEDAWRSASPLRYEWGENCDPARRVEWSGATLEYKAELDCEAEGALGPGPSENVTVVGACFNVEAAATLQVDFVADAGTLTILLESCAPVGGLTPEHLQTKIVEAGASLALPFAPCTWELVVTAPRAQPSVASVRITR